MKLCVDCKYALNTMPDYRPSKPSLGDYVWYCQHPASTIPAAQPSLVTGRVEPPQQLSCTEARGRGSMANCGPEGKLWEPREEPICET
jgi:hypothetical protein